MKTTQNQQKGFTIIEVVLVLAIAGLIFLIVFLAVPALQRSQRDTQRRNDVGRFMSQISNYQSNNNGEVPTTGAQVTNFVSSYLSDVDGADDVFNDPTTGVTYVVERNGDIDELDVGDMFYYTATRCNGEVVEPAAGGRTVAVVVALEGGGNFCQDNR